MWKKKENIKDQDNMKKSLYLSNFLAQLEISQGGKVDCAPNTNDSLQVVFI